MQNIKIQEGQNLLDIAVQATGNVYDAFTAVQLSNISLTADLAIGSTVLINDADVSKQALVNEIAANNFVPASALNMDTANGEDVTLLEGVSYWAIGIDFTVN